MRFTNVKCLTGYLFRFDVIVMVYSIRFIAFTITSSFASLTGFPRSFQSLSGKPRKCANAHIPVYWLTFYVLARFKDLRLKDEKRTHTPAIPVAAAVAHTAIGVNAPNIAGISSFWCLIRICKPIPIINQRNVLSKLHK